jgi:hypothetical protein
MHLRPVEQFAAEVDEFHVLPFAVRVRWC